ncbi:MAG: hypothetical protein K2X27_18395 [Candidatus Obscuribacterales bacterium]|nr:hypothetical protein [Candidatus Obscuribacterales bacterium]
MENSSKNDLRCYVLATVISVLLTASTVCFSIIPWIKEYHLRAFDHYEFSGDRARLNGDLTESEHYYRAARQSAQEMGDQKRAALSSKELKRILNLRREALRSESSESKVATEEADPWIWKSSLDYLSMLQRSASQRRWTALLRPVFQKQLDSARESPAKIIQFADSQMEMSNYQQAQKLYENAQEMTSDKADSVETVELLDKLARAAFAQMNYGLANTYLDLALNKVQASPQTNALIASLKLNKAQLWAESNKPELGLEICEQIKDDPIFALNPQRKWYLDIIKGQCHSLMGQQQTALSILRRTAKEAPILFGVQSSKVNRAYETLAEALIREGRKEEAYSYFEKLFELENQQTHRNQSRRRFIISEEVNELKLSRSEIAAALCDWFVELRARELGTNFRPKKCRYSHLIDVYKEAGDLKKSKEYQQKLDEFLKAAG